MGDVNVSTIKDCRVQRDVMNLGSLHGQGDANG